MIEKAKNIIAGLFWKFVLFLVVYGVRTYLLVVYRPKMTFLGSVKSTDLKEPMIIIANHTSMLDPLMVQSLFFHKRSIVVAKDQVEDPHFSWALKRFKNVIPCDRFNLDTEWALLAKKELEKGNSVIIFPEGKCRYDGLLNEFKTGFAFLIRFFLSALTAFTRWVTVRRFWWTNPKRLNVSREFRLPSILQNAANISARRSGT